MYRNIPGIFRFTDLRNSVATALHKGGRFTGMARLVEPYYQRISHVILSFPHTQVESDGDCGGEYRSFFELKHSLHPLCGLQC